MVLEAAGWLRDPLGIYEHRYWAGDAWTNHVALHGAQLVDSVTDPAELPHPGQQTAVVAPPPPPGDSWVLADAGWLPDPVDSKRFRYWDGQEWTRQVARDGVPTQDERTDCAHLVEPRVPRTLGSQSAVARTKETLVRATGGENKSAGDRIVHAVGEVTLNGWMMRRVADSFHVPQLVDAVRADPRNPLPRLHLGLRLDDMRIAHERFRRAMPMVSPAQIVTRPVTRAVTKAAVQALRSDTTPAHVKVLRPLHRQLVNSVSERPKNADALNAIARIYWATGHLPRAMDALEVSRKANSGNGETFYIGAEILLDMRQWDLALDWARHAWALGCYLSAAILAPDGPRNRQYRTAKGSRLTGYQHKLYLGAMAGYFAPVPQDQLDAFIGESWIVAAPRVGHG